MITTVLTTVVVIIRGFPPHPTSNHKPIIWEVLPASLLGIILLRRQQTSTTYNRDQWLIWILNSIPGREYIKN